MRTISEVLDRAKKAQKVKSDYKLSLCIGIGESSLADYRKGRGLPDETNCIKLANAMGENPALLTVEMQAQRARTPEAREVWMGIARRLQMGVSSVLFSCMLTIIAIAATTLPARASTFSVSSERSPTVYYVNYLKRAVCPFLNFIVKISKFVSVFGFRGNYYAL